jgi:hypothetical protein
LQVENLRLKEQISEYMKRELVLIEKEQLIMDRVEILLMREKEVTEREKQLRDMENDLKEKMKRMKDCESMLSLSYIISSFDLSDDELKQTISALKSQKTMSSR